MRGRPARPVRSASRCGRSCATPWLRVPGWCSFAPKNATARLRIRFMPFIAHAFDGGQAWRVMNAQEIIMAHLSPLLDRKRVVKGKRVAGRLELGCGRINK